MRKLDKESCCDFLTEWLNVKERKYRRKMEEKEKIGKEMSVCMEGKGESK